MTFGLQIFNPNNGKLVVSESYPAYHYRGNASFQATAASGSGGGYTWLSNQHRYTISLDTAGLTILPFVVNASNQYSCIDAVVDNGEGNYTVYVRSGTQPTRVLIFSTLGSLSPAESFGLEVMTAEGTRFFDSNRKPMYLRNVRAITGAGFGSVGSSTVLSVTTPAIFCGNIGVERYTNYTSIDTTYYEFVLAARVSGTSLQFASLGVSYKATINSPPLVDIPSPEYYQDQLSQGIVAMLDANIY